MSDIKVKGFIIARYLELAREKLGDGVAEAIESGVGISLKELKFSFFKDFPVQLQLDVEARVAEAIWGDPYPISAYQVGRVNFETFAASAIGRTMLALVGGDPRKILRNTIRVTSTVVSGLEVEVRDQEDGRFSIRFHNSPHEPEGWRGTIDAALEHVGVKPSVEIVRHGPLDTEFLIGWS